MKLYVVDIRKLFLRGEVISEFPFDVQCEINKHKERDHYEESLGAWYVLKEALSKDFNININDLKLKHNDYGKPFYDEISFNISHSYGLVAVAISSTWCGVDIEKITDVSLKLSEKILSFKEKLVFDMIPNDTQKRNYLIRQWVIKEAYYKMTGTGLSYAKLKEPLGYPVDNIYFEEITIDQSNSYYLAAVGDVGKIEVFKKL